MSLEDQLNNLPEGIESSDVKELRSVIFRMQKQLLKAKTKTDDLVEATHQSAYDAMLTFGPVKDVTPPPVDKRKSRVEVALWHMTDWQGQSAPRAMTLRSCGRESCSSPSELYASQRYRELTIL